jgi:hypothetical protein
MASKGIPKDAGISTRFKKGVSGNPGGRPRAIVEIETLARSHSVEAIENIVRIMRDEKTPAAAVIAAAQTILDRAWGRAKQQVAHTGSIGGLGAILDAAFRRLEQDDAEPVESDPNTQH